MVVRRVPGFVVCVPFGFFIYLAHSNGSGCQDDHYDPARLADGVRVVRHWAKVGLSRES